MKLQGHRFLIEATIKAVIAILLAGLSLLPIGCTAVHDHVLATTVTVIGVQIHQKDQDKTPEVKIGYARSEFAFVPTDHETARNSTDQGTKGPASGSARNSAEVLMEINAQGSIGLGTAYQGGVYQRLAVGQTAVTQPGAAFMMAKNADGKLDKDSADAVSKALQKIPQTPGDVLTAREPLRKAYLALPNKKAVFDEAVKPDFADFRSFLIGDPKTPDLETVKKIRKKLEDDGDIKKKLDEVDQEPKPK